MATVKNAANSASRPAIAISPLPIVSASILPRSFNAPAITANAAPNTISDDAVFLRFLALVSNSLTAATIVPNATATPRMLVINSSGLMLDITFNAPAIISIAPDILNRFIIEEFKPKIPFTPPILLNAANATTNSANITPIAVSEGIKLSGLIEANNTSEPANTAIAPAIFINDLAFRSF